MPIIRVEKEVREAQRMDEMEDVYTVVVYAMYGVNPEAQKDFTSEDDAKKYAGTFEKTQIYKNFYGKGCFTR